MNTLGFVSSENPQVANVKETILSNIEVLDKAHAELDALLSELHRRLEPIIQQVNSEDTPVVLKGAKDSSSEVSAMLKAQTTSVHNQIHEVNYILSHIELP